jgi:uncharacterized protein YecT (DUF1311 family)
MSVLAPLLFAASLPILDGNQIDCSQDHSQAAETICIWRDYRKADAEMNVVWRTALATAKAIDRELQGQSGPSGVPSKKSRDSLLASQRAFLTYRKETCDFVRIINAPGTKAPADQGFCLMKITKDRIQQLRNFRSLESR